jgi:hypothetical protein
MTEMKPMLAASAQVSKKPSNHPASFAARVAGREKQRLGELFGLKGTGSGRWGRACARGFRRGARPIVSSTARTRTPSISRWAIAPPATKSLILPTT